MDEKNQKTIPAGEEATAAEPERGQEASQQLRGDPESFAKRFPGMSLHALEENDAFRRFCGSRFYTEDAEQLFADYEGFAESAMQSARQRLTDRRERSTGGGGGRADNGLTPQQQQELSQWNRSYPNMRMTPSEFLSR